MDGADAIEKRPFTLPRLTAGDSSLEAAAAALLAPLTPIDAALGLIVAQVADAGELGIDDDYTRLIEPALHAAGIQNVELQTPVLEDSERAADRLTRDTDAFVAESLPKDTPVPAPGAPGPRGMSRFTDAGEDYEPPRPRTPDDTGTPPPLEL